MYGFQERLTCAQGHGNTVISIVPVVGTEGIQFSYISAYLVVLTLLTSGLLSLVLLCSNLFL
jgi:hypothetical protein